MTQQRRNRPIALWVVSVVAVGFALAFGVFSLSLTVNAIAYLAGADGQGTFTATKSVTNCSYDGSTSTCSTDTYGYLDPGHIPATWIGQVHGSFPVRRPVWVWRDDAPLFNQGTAIFTALSLGCIQLALAVTVPFVAHRGYRAWRSAWRGRPRGRSATA
jgi:hypothetical protein